MFQLPSLLKWWPSRNSRGNHRRIDIPPLEVHETETSAEKRTRTLKHLLRANHANHSLLWDHPFRYNDMSLLLGSAYLLGLEGKRLIQLYDQVSERLWPWKDSPGEIARHDWRAFLGDKRYQRAYVDFFEDELVRHRYDWKKLVKDYFFDGGADASSPPLISRALGGQESDMDICIPLVYLAYAYELSSPTIAIQALALAAVCNNDDGLAKYLLADLSDTAPIAPSPPPPPPPPQQRQSSPSSLMFECLESVQKDDRFGDMFAAPAEQQQQQQKRVTLRDILESHEAELHEHWSRWDIVPPPLFYNNDNNGSSDGGNNNNNNDPAHANLAASFRATQKLAVHLLLGSVRPSVRADMSRAGEAEAEAGAGMEAGDDSSYTAGAGSGAAASAASAGSESAAASGAAATAGCGLYDMRLAHVLAANHALRVLLPFMPAALHVPLVRHWWRFALVSYVAAGRPPVLPLPEEKSVRRSAGSRKNDDDDDDDDDAAGGGVNSAKGNTETKKNDWHWVIDKTVNMTSRHLDMPLYLPVIRALTVAGRECCAFNVAENLLDGGVCDDGDDDARNGDNGDNGAGVSSTGASSSSSSSATEQWYIDAIAARFC